eukprot:TRINITY_DN1646_c0_g2_i1.p1 TRINITY_DN1646_c0_g2~~TRINITY_DN1646_c0_g2_i1.p1  ORF type:complete len:266 (-),score=31.18 TRINITY_DN1646_c0_g2_i1:115-912(-)
MAHNIITQVEKDENSIHLEDEKYDSSYKGKQSKSFFMSLCCCFGNKPVRGISSDSDLKDGSEMVPTKTSNIETIAKAGLLPISKKKNKVCLVLDLDETLVHSSFKPVEGADFIIPVEIEDIVHQVYVLKRPFVDEFLKRVGGLFEVVVFTASLSKYADPVLDLLDKYKVVDYRLFRESCTLNKTNYVKDLGRIGRTLKKTIIIDNSPYSYAFHPQNAIPVESWFDDKNDRELLELLPFLEEAAKCDDVIKFLKEKGLVNGLSNMR